MTAPENDGKMKNVVKEANEWCRSAMGIETVTRSAIEKIGQYYSDLSDNGILDYSLFEYVVDDLVPCFENLSQRSN